ncbi:MAG: hypothetical protein ABSA97_07390 [Verrucomicrobiia bacterium]
MDIFIGFSTGKFYTGLDCLGQLDRVDLNQDAREPLYIYFAENKAVKDMSDWIVTAGFVGTPGKPTGTAGGPDMAALTTALTFDDDPLHMYFEGLLDCNTDETELLIGTSDFEDTVFAVRATLPDADPALVLRKQSLCACRVFAAAIEDMNAGGLSLLRSTPIGLTVAAGELVSAAIVVPGILRADLCRQLLPGDGTTAPSVVKWTANENPGDSNLNTLECELAAAPSTNITIYVEVLANG